MFHSVSIIAAPPPTRPSSWTCEDVVALVSSAKNVPIRLFNHRSRCSLKDARARQLAMYLCHVMLGRSLTEVGIAFQRDRTTVSYACALIEDLREDPAFDDEVCDLEALIEAGLDCDNG